MTVLFAIICSLFMIGGIVGSIVPGIPGVPLAWLGLLVFAIGTGFEKISITITIIFFVVMLLTLAIDFLAPMLGAKGLRASKWGIIGAFLGIIIGTIVFGFWGIIFGPFIGAFLLELLTKRQPKGALKSALGTILGYLSGTLLKIVVVLIMMGFFISSLF